MGALQDELIGIRLELKGVREAVEGFKDVDRAQEKVSHSTTKAGAAASRAERKTSGLTRAYQSLGKTARWGLGFLGVGGVFALKSAIEHSEDLAKTTTGLTRNLDLNTNVASRWGAVAQAREIDSKALTMSFTTLSRKLTEAAREGGTALTPFHQIGITQNEAAEGADNFSWFLGRLAEKFGDAEGGAKRQAAAQGLLGRGYSTILPLFSEGAKGLQEQFYWADKYGVTLSGTTNEALMESVTAQRESKMAMLGLQLALTNALLPAIDAGHHELQKFIATLNDPDMSGDQKIAAIERQFEGIEEKLVDVLTAALPHIAEHGGELGVKLAGALWQGFIHSDGLGKLVISAWLFHAFGGPGLIKEQAKKAGLLTGRWFTVGTVLGIVLSGYLVGQAIGESLPTKTREAIRQWGLNAGQNFVNALIWAVNQGIQRINDALDDANPLGALGVDAPNIGEVGEVNFHTGQERQEADVHNAPPGSINGPGGSIIGPDGEQIKPPVGNPNWRNHQRHHSGRSHRLPRAVTQRTQRLPAQSLPRDGRGWGRGRLGSITIQVPLDGKVIAEKTVDIAELEASLN